MSPERAVGTDNLIRELSLGVSLRWEPSLVAAQINSVVRGVPLLASDILEETRLRPLSDSSVRSFLTKSKTELDRFNSDQMQTQNEWTELLRDGRPAGKSMMAAIDSVRSESYTRRFCAEVDRVLRDGKAELRYRDEAPSVPHEFSFIVVLLVSECGFGEAELRALAEKLRSEGVCFIPFFGAKVALEACYVWKRKRLTPNDQYDVTRIACALPFADLLITDGSATSAIRDTELDRSFGTQVLSTKDAERASMLQILTDWLEDDRN